MYKFVSICNGTRDSARARIHGGKWTTRPAFFSFLLSRLFVSSKLSKETRRYVKSTWWRPALFLQRRATLPLNSIKRFHLHFAARTVFRATWQMEARRRRSSHGKSFVSSLLFVSSPPLHLFQGVRDVLQRERKRERKEKGRRIL